MARYFTTYWAKSTWDEHKNWLDRILINHAASEQFIPEKKVNIGDYIYIVHVSKQDKKERRLWLGSRIKVTWIGSREEACKKLDTENLWEAKYHIIGDYNKAMEMFFDLDITEKVYNQELLFLNESKLAPLKVDGHFKGVDHQQFKPMREMPYETAKILDEVLDDAKNIERTFKQRVIRLKMAKEILERWSKEHYQFFGLWALINNTYNDYRLPRRENSERNRIKAFCEDVVGYHDFAGIWEVAKDFHKLPLPLTKPDRYPEVFECRKRLKEGHQNVYDLLRIIYHFRCFLFHGETLAPLVESHKDYKKCIKESIPILEYLIEEITSENISILENFDKPAQNKMISDDLITKGENATKFDVSRENDEAFDRAMEESGLGQWTKPFDVATAEEENTEKDGTSEEDGKFSD